MRKTLIAAAVASAVAVPNAASAVEVAGKMLEIYGKFHVSADYQDPDAAGADSNLSVSSNSSRLGFKGAYQIEPGLTAVYKLEQQVNLDETGGSFATRNSYVGLKGGFGEVLVGYHDTPFKDVGGKFTLFGDTVADRRALLGAGAASGNRVNNRARNMIMYRNSVGGFDFAAVYGADQSGSAGATDDNENDLFSVGGFFKAGALKLGAAYETYSSFREGKLDAIRLGASYTINALTVGGVYESLSHDLDAGGSGEFDRDAYGMNVSYKLGSTKLMGQVMVADENDTADTGATMVSLGVSQKLAKQLEVYAVYTTTQNDDAAAFQGIDGGHGDELKTENGGSPSAFSVGTVFKF